MVDDGDRCPECWCDWPAPSLEIDLIVGVTTPREVEGQVQVQQAGIRAGADHAALFFQGLVPRVVG